MSVQHSPGRATRADARPPEGGAAFRDTAIVAAGRALVAVAFVGAWAWGHWLVGATYIASPFAVAARIVADVASGALWVHLAASLLVAAVGFCAGWVAGFAVPLALSRSPRAMAAFEPAIVVAMGIPLFALIPLLILWFGIGFAPKIVIVAFMVFFIVFITTLSGLRAIDRKLLDMARVLGASDWQLTTRIRRQAMRPFLFAGLKLAVPRALSATIVGEFLVADRGLGYRIEQARQTADSVGVFAGIVIVTLLVLGLDALLTAWHRSRARGPETVAAIG